MDSATDMFVYWDLRGIGFMELNCFAEQLQS